MLTREDDIVRSIEVDILKEMSFRTMHSKYEKFPAKCLLFK